jgi:hypothetical protein
MDMSMGYTDQMMGLEKEDVSSRKTAKTRGT